MTPYEKLNAQQQQDLAQQFEQDILRQYGMLVPGAPIHYADPSTRHGSCVMAEGDFPDNPNRGFRCIWTAVRRRS